MYAVCTLQNLQKKKDCTDVVYVFSALDLL